MLKISIPKPCHEDWEAMTPNTQGRHCNSCVKTVVDFTEMNDEEVKHFFLNKKEERVCGRFSTVQLQRITIELPGNIFLLRIPFWKKFLAASLLVFSTTLFSCDTKLKGEPMVTTTIVESSSNEAMGKTEALTLLGDTTIALPQPVCINDPGVIVGVIMPPPVIEQGETIIKGGIDMIDTVPANTAVKNKLPVIMGDWEMEPDSLTIKNPAKADTGNCDKQIFY
jgi:hypothetical protein